MTAHRTFRTRLLNGLAGAVAIALLVAGCADSGLNDITLQRTSGSEVPVATEAIAPTTIAPVDPQCDNTDGGDPTKSIRPVAADIAASVKLAEIRKRGKLLAGVDQDTLLFGSRNPATGVIEGFDIDMLRVVSKAIFNDGSADRLELVPIKYKDRVQSLVDGKVDVVADTFTIKCSRWARINFSTEYYHASQKILVRKDSTAKSLADLSGKRVCAAEGSTSVDNIKNGNPKAEVKAVLDQTDCLILFQSSQVDAISTDDTILLGLVAQDPNAKLLADSFSPEPYGLGLPKSDPAFTGFVNQVLEDMRANGEWKKIHKLWLGNVFPGATPEPPAASYR